LKNIDEISREDYISKLFIDNEHKLDESPSGDLWSRIETKLEQTSLSSGKENLPRTTIAARKGIIMRMVPYIAAASVLIIISVAISLFQWPKQNNTLAESKEEVEDVDLPTAKSETIPIIPSDKDSAFEEEDQRQKIKMLQEAKKQAGKESKKAEASVEKYGLDIITINEKSNDVITMTPEPAKDEEDNSFISRPRAEYNDFSTTNGNVSNSPQIVPRSDYQNQNRNYANPPSADPAMADKIESYIKGKENMSTKKGNESKTQSRIKNKSVKSLQSNQQLDSHLKIFEWLLGQWTDEEEEGGIAYENWRWINANTIEGIGTKIKENNKIFEERLSIYYDNSLKQVFLKMQIDDTKNQVIYMLSSFDTERIVFEQNEDPGIPNKVIFQRHLNGYSTTIAFDQGFLKPAQQSYLDHRNRVSNVKALRILNRSEEK
jgi:hypothetical protein